MPNCIFGINNTITFEYLIKRPKHEIRRNKKTFNLEHIEYVMIAKKKKLEVFRYFKEFKIGVVKEIKGDIKILRCDNGGEYISKDFIAI